MENKICKTCKQNLKTTDFYTRTYASGEVKLWNECKNCANIRTRENRLKRRKTNASEYYSKSRAYGKKRYKHDKEAHKNRGLKKKYGITLDDWLHIFEEQGGRCAICRDKGEKEISDKYRKKGMLAVDHCHTTGKVRGLLCRKCNMAIGGLKDDLTIIQRAYDYILRHQE